VWPKFGTRQSTSVKVSLQKSEHVLFIKTLKSPRSVLCNRMLQFLEEIAERKRVGARYVRRLMRPAFLAPKIVEMIAAGSQPPDLTAEALAERNDLPLLWAEQEQAVLVS
jgi:hypothetical protein